MRRRGIVEAPRRDRSLSPRARTPPGEQRPRRELSCARARYRVSDTGRVAQRIGRVISLPHRARLAHVTIRTARMLYDFAHRRAIEFIASMLTEARGRRDRWAGSFDRAKIVGELCANKGLQEACWTWRDGVKKVPEGGPGTQARFASHNTVHGNPVVRDRAGGNGARSGGIMPFAKISARPRRTQGGALDREGPNSEDSWKEAFPVICDPAERCNRETRGHELAMDGIAGRRFATRLF